MDQRSEPRFAVDESVIITTLGEHSFRQTAWVKNVSGNGLGVVAPLEIAPGTILRIERDDALLLGEVMFCRRIEHGHFVGVHLEQILRGLAELHQRFGEFEEAQSSPRSREQDPGRGTPEGAKTKS